LDGKPNTSDINTSVTGGISVTTQSRWRS